MYAPLGERSAPMPPWLRRALFAAVTGTSVLGLAALLLVVLATAGIGPVAALMIAALFVNAVWVALVFWNAVLGFALLRLFRRPALHNWAELADVPATAPLTQRTAVAMTVRNEAAAGVFARLKATKASLDRTDSAAAFDYFILSDSAEPAAIAAEATCYAAWCAEGPDIAAHVTYRRRASNRGFKPGNIRDFCERWGGAYEFMVLLDADSLMTGETIVRLVRAMQHLPHVGILQSLIVGILHPSLFARLYEFGHRQVARCASVGATWWQGDRCQFWGHNAIVRIAPFARHCAMPHRPGRGPFAGHILCHDQIEASFMHRAGFAVRVLPEETGSFEGNPPTIVDYAKRNDRWCQGNFQNLSVAGAPGLALIDRFHLTVVAQRFLAYPALLVFILLAALETALWPAGRAFPAEPALLLYGVWACMFLAPRLLGGLDALIREPARYGGRARLALGGAVELAAAFFLVPITIVATSLFMAGLPRKRGPAWAGQRRDAYRLSWRAAAAALWPQTAVGIGLSAWLSVARPAAQIWFAPFTVGLVLSIPFAVLTASPAISAAARRAGLCATPEEIDVPREIADVAETAMP